VIAENGEVHGISNGDSRMKVLVFMAPNAHFDGGGHGHGHDHGHKHGEHCNH
jgi:hypothetical protein